MPAPAQSVDDGGTCARSGDRGGADPHAADPDGLVRVHLRRAADYALEASIQPGV
jgi:hypothetical protein